MNRYSPFPFRQDVTIKNRVVVPPMASQTATEKGFITAQTVANYRRLGRSGAGLIFVEYTYVHPSGKGSPQHLGADNDEKIAGLAELADVIHDSGAIAGLQLVHVGGKSKSELTGGRLMAPSAIPVPVQAWEPEVPMAMSHHEINLWQEWFVAAAGRAVAAGFDVMELHAAHGYGLNQWLSPITNQRDDDYGGAIQGRSRLLLEIAGEIKRRWPQKLLAVRLPAQDYLPRGLTPAEMAKVVAGLEGVGVDLLDVSSGLGGWRRVDGRSGEGYLVPDATLIKTFSSLPVIGVGGIETGEFIDEIIARGKVDFAAVGRAILADPEAWRLSHLPNDAT